MSEDRLVAPYAGSRHDEAWVGVVALGIDMDGINERTPRCIQCGMLLNNCLFHLEAFGWDLGRLH